MHILNASTREVSATILKNWDLSLKSIYSNNAFFPEQFVTVKGLWGFHIFWFNYDCLEYVFCQSLVMMLRFLWDFLSLWDNFLIMRDVGRFLTRERQAYLYNRIRPFVTNPWKDLLCPLVQNEKWQNKICVTQS